MGRDGRCAVARHSDTTESDVAGSGVNLERVRALPSAGNCDQPIVSLAGCGRANVRAIGSRSPRRTGQDLREISRVRRSAPKARRNRTDSARAVRARKRINYRGVKAGQRPSVLVASLPSHTQRPVGGEGQSTQGATRRLQARKQKQRPTENLVEKQTAEPGRPGPRHLSVRSR